MSFANAILTPGIAPPWLLGTVGAAKLQMFGATLDQLTGPGGKLGQAGYVANPLKCDATLLPYIGRDHLLPQGAGETTAAYRVRLQGAQDEWRLYGGSPWGVLRQMRVALLPNAPLMRVVSNTGAWDWFADGASTSVFPVHQSPYPTRPSVWNWDGYGFGAYTDPSPPGISAWWRFWAIVFSVSPTIWCNSLGTWGSTGKKWGDTTVSWGTDTPPPIFRALQAAIVNAKAEHAWCRWLVICFSPTIFGPEQNADGAHNPDGKMGRWSKIVNGQYVPSRITTARYADVPT